MTIGLDDGLRMVPNRGIDPLRVEDGRLPDTSRSDAPQEGGFREDSTMHDEATLQPQLAPQADFSARGPGQFQSVEPALFLLFPPGTRPAAETLVDLVATGAATGLSARVSHRPEPDAGWLELLASGLTFDVRGLAPAAAAPALAVHGLASHRLGFNGEPDLAGHEAIALVPSGHIVAGVGLQPVLRTMMGMAAGFALGLPASAVSWGPAGTLMEPRTFARMVLDWLAGGAFPALGLTALLRAEDGSIASRGLSQFIGQEMQMEGRAGESPQDTAKLAIRVIDHLVREGRVLEPRRIGAGPDALLAEPSQVGRLVLVWREGEAA